MKSALSCSSHDFTNSQFRFYESYITNQIILAKKIQETKPTKESFLLCTKHLKIGDNLQLGIGNS